MENAVEALKIAFAVIVFGMALTISMVMFTQAKSTSDAVVEMQDETNYYDYYTYDDNEVMSKYQKRVVGLETVIPTLYKYYRENYTVIFKVGTYNKETGEVTYSGANNGNLILYRSKSPYKATYSGRVLWGDYRWQNYWGDISATDNRIYDICSFDVDEEIKRREPWSGKQSDMKHNIDCFLNGETFVSPDGNVSRNTKYDGITKLIQSNGGNVNNPKFVEELGEYIYERDESGEVESSGTTITIDGETTSILRKNKKRVITYTLITNN